MAVAPAIRRIKLCDDSATTGPQWSPVVAFTLKIERRSQP
jgi:hypothetical protein